MVRALDGLKVLDLAGFPGMWTAMMLADFGAEVIRVEPPDNSPHAQRTAAMSTSRQFRQNQFNRGKRSVTLDLRSAEGGEAARRLATRTDVLVEGFRPDVADRLGVGFERLATENPRLIFCSISGYGLEGPYRDLPGHNDNYLAMAGLLDLIGPPGGPPILPGVLIGDMAAGLSALAGILLALQARERTGRGQRVDTSIFDSVFAMGTLQYLSHWNDPDAILARGQADTGGGMARYYVYPTADDKYFSVGCVEPHFWTNLCTALGREQHIVDHANPDRERQRAIIDDLSAVFRTRSRDEWWAYLRDKNLCVAPVKTLAEASEDPQTLHRQLILVEEDGGRPFRQLGMTIKLGDTPGAVTTPSPPRGAHTEEVLREIGLI